VTIWQVVYERRSEALGDIMHRAAQTKLGENVLASEGSDALDGVPRA
jgi:hypothetical protein